MKNANSIAIVFNGLYVGGAEKFGISLANKLVVNGFITTIFLFKKIDSPLMNQINVQIEIVYIERKSKFDFVLHKKFKEEIRRRNIGKVFIIGLMPLFLSRIFSFTFRRKYQLSYFISLHSTAPASMNVYLRNLIFLRFVKKTDKVIFICQNQLHFYNNKYYFKPKLFDVIYNGVDVDYFKPGNEFAIQSKKKLNQIAVTDKVILLVATIRKEKGHSYAIESLHKLHTNYPDKMNTHLVFIGDGERSYIEELKILVDRFSLQSFVHFEGSQQDVRPYYEIADLFTLTSISVETFSIAALEAMCYGLPLSLTDIGGASEMIIKGKNGLLSKAKDAGSIAESWAALLNAGLDKRVIRKMVVENFSLDLMFANYLKAMNN